MEILLSRCHKKEEKVKVQRYLWEVKSLVNPTNFQLDELLGIWEASGFENALPGVFKRAFLKLQTRIDAWFTQTKKFKNGIFFALKIDCKMQIWQVFNHQHYLNKYSFNSSSKYLLSSSLLLPSFRFSNFWWFDETSAILLIAHYLRQF